MNLMESHTIFAIYGGLLIGLSASLLLLMNGKVAGISGIIKQAVFIPTKQNLWRWFFIAGLLLGGMLAHQMLSIPIPHNSQSWLIAAAAGLLVGIGTSVGNGCTSGHGVCGIGRLSPRSLVATITFMLIAIIVVSVMRHLL